MHTQEMITYDGGLLWECDTAIICILKAKLCAYIILWNLSTEYCYWHVFANVINWKLSLPSNRAVWGQFLRRMPWYIQSECSRLFLLYRKLDGRAAQMICKRLHSYEIEVVTRDGFICESRWHMKSRISLATSCFWKRTRKAECEILERSRNEWARSVHISCQRL